MAKVRRTGCLQADLTPTQAFIITPVPLSKILGNTVKASGSFMAPVFFLHNNKVQSFGAVHFALSLEKTFALQMHAFSLVCTDVPTQRFIFCSKSLRNSFAVCFFLKLNYFCEEDT